MTIFNDDFVIQVKSSQCTGVDADSEWDSDFISGKEGVHVAKHFGAVSPSDQWFVVKNNKVAMVDSEEKAWDAFLGEVNLDCEDWIEIDKDGCADFG